uniref:Endothelial cell surface expressed chemotaxis and apoptosis regulator n=1 Tax=Gallus gallus TaxID=9031 RepID=A0A8V0Y1Q4_CHICK
MLAPALHPLLWLFGCVLLRGTTAATGSSIHNVTDQPQSTTRNHEVGNNTSEPSVKSAAPADLSLTHTDQTTTAKSSSISPTRLTSSAQDEESGGSRNTTAPSAPGTSGTVTPALEISVSLPVPTPTEYESPLTVVAFGVISFIVILVVVVIILVSVVSLRFKCNRSKDSEDKQKPGSSMVSEGCSAGTSEKDNSITLISMKNINMNNSKTYPPSEKVL